ncbi:YhcB family protein [Denitrificimonas caeni]|uniref:YhcB family protein n=1 Tax=Denitrificimonas caeni TaxID=521720 RepID=UPI001964AC35|nr:DUF1043 family protein [Denitrificimonas caeni]
MEQSLPIWLIPTLTLVGGIIIGVILARVLQRTAPGQTQRQLDELQERFDSYQSEVVTHFNTTANLVKKLTQNYQDVQEHLSVGAERLALDEVTRERLMASLVDDTKPRERIRAPQDSQFDIATEPPRDYAQKKEGDPSMLAEGYGLKR